LNTSRFRLLHCSHLGLTCPRPFHSLGRVAFVCHSLALTSPTSSSRLAMFPRSSRFPPEKRRTFTPIRYTTSNLQEAQRLTFPDLDTITLKVGFPTLQHCPGANKLQPPSDPEPNYKHGAFLEKTDRFGKEKASDVPGKQTLRRTGRC
jgi:hypothetical protein